MWFLILIIAFDTLLSGFPKHIEQFSHDKNPFCVVLVDIRTTKEQNYMKTKQKYSLLTESNRNFLYSFVWVFQTMGSANFAYDRDGLGGFFIGGTKQ